MGKDKFLKEFKAPEAIYRSAPFWSWNDKLDGEELKRQINEMAEKGWGGYFMHSRVGLVTGYLSEDWMEMIRTCAEEARATNTYAWLYDEDKWPSGFAGGEVSSNEEYRSRALVLLKEGEAAENDSILKKVEIQGEKYIICKRISALGDAWFNGTCYVDLMNPKAVEAFIQCTHERYKEACGEYFGKEIPGMFTDEPCYLMHGSYKDPVLPWSDYLPDFFSQLKGYDIREHLAQLFFDIEDYRKIRFDFFDAATKLFVESFTKPYFNWCEENNLKMTGHFMAEDNLTYQLEWIGAAMPHYEFMHWPGIDKLGRNLNQLVTVKQVGSVADQLGKERSFSEVFGCIGQQSSFYHRKWIADWQAVLGISFVNSHLSLYSMRGERKRDFPANLYYQQPWWDDERKFSDYIGRLSFAVTRGKRDVDVLVIHPIASVWSEYSPLHKGTDFSAEKEIYDAPFTELSQKLISNKLDFHYGDEIIMENHARVEGNKLIIGQHEYSTIIVPPSITLRSNTMALLKEFVKAAGSDRVVWMTPWADRIDGIKTDIEDRDQALKAETVEQVISILDKYYKDRISIIDEATGANASKVICQQRIAEEGRYFLIANTDEDEAVSVVVSLPGDEKPLLVDLMSGELYSIPAAFAEGRGEAQMKLYPAGSILVFYPNQCVEAKPAPLFLDSGVEFKSELNIIKTINDWEVRLLEPNVMPLHEVTLTLGNEKVMDKEPVAKAWHEWFYKAPEGTPFKAEYSFNVLNIPDGEIFAAIEVAENLDRITINGTEVKPLKTKGELGAFDPEKSWKDINFTRVPLTGLISKGNNVLVLEGKKSNNITRSGCHIGVKNFKDHMPTEVETVYILGDFTVVDEDRTRFSIDAGCNKNLSRDLTSSGYPFYAGKAAFKSVLNWNPIEKDVYLKLQDVEAACVELYVNGRYVDVKYYAPYVFNISDFLKEGENEIEIVAATTLFNIMGPNRIEGIKEMEFIGPYTFVDFKRYVDQYAFFPFGIGGCSLIG